MVSSCLHGPPFVNRVIEAALQMGSEYLDFCGSIDGKHRSWKWWIFPWRTVSHNGNWILFVETVFLGTTLICGSFIKFYLYSSLIRRWSFIGSTPFSLDSTLIFVSSVFNWFVWLSRFVLFVLRIPRGLVEILINIDYSCWWPRRSCCLLWSTALLVLVPTHGVYGHLLTWSLSRYLPGGTFKHQPWPPKTKLSKNMPFQREHVLRMANWRMCSIDFWSSKSARKVKFETENIMSKCEQ